MKKPAFLHTRFVRTVLAVSRGFQENHVMIYASHATLMILMSILPLTMLLVTILNNLPGYSTESFLNLVFRLLPDIPEIRELAEGIVGNLYENSTGAMVSLAAVTTLWSASAGVSAIQKALIRITAGSRGTRYDRGLAVLYTLLFLLLLIAVLLIQVLGGSIAEGVSALSRTMGLPDLLGAIRRILRVSRAVLLGVMFFFLLLMYRFFPGGVRTLRSQVPGAVFTTVLWTAFSALFSVFIPRFWRASSIYGSLASVFLVALWTRYSIVILLTGAVLNRTLEEGKLKKKRGKR